MFLAFIAIVIGYLLGSINPAYILGRVLRGIDIRDHGTGNAGTTNLKRLVGWWPAVVAATYDVLKGLLAMFIAYKLGLDLQTIYAVGFAAVVGHIFPFYLKFRGGQGIATSVGILLFSLFVILRQNFLPFENILILAILVLALLFVTRTGELIGIIVLPTLAYFIFKNYSLNTVTISAGILILYIFSIEIINILTQNVLEFKPETIREVRHWRFWLRPAAIAFPLLYFYFPKMWTLILVGSIGLIFLVIDIVRLSSSGVNVFLFKNVIGMLKEKEKEKISSITSFLIATFVVVLFFPKEIAIFSMMFLIFGDMFAKFFGVQYGRIHTFEGKTLEGSVAHLAACLVSGFFFLNYLPLSPLIMVIGAFAATLVEILPLRVEDNFSVPLGAAAVMFLLEKVI